MERCFQLLFALLFFLSSTCYCNWGAGSIGGAVGTGTFSDTDIFSSLGTQQVEMQTEDLTITLYRGEVAVDVEYLLRNTEDSVLVRAGFPYLQYNKCNEENNELYDYKILENGKPIRYTDNSKDICPLQQLDDSGGPPDFDIPCKCIHWYISDVSFLPAEAKKIRIQYRAQYAQEYGAGVGDIHFTLGTHTYILHTGAVWKGPIQKGTVKIIPYSLDTNDLFIPKQFKWDSQENLYIWKFQNYEPEGTIEIGVKNSYIANDAHTFNWYIEQNNKKFTMYKDFDQASATSCLNNKEYNPMVLTGKVHGTAWVEGKRGSGIGESVTLTLNEPTVVHEIGFTPGFYKDTSFAKSRELYFANNRVADAQVIINGTHTYNKHFFDEHIVLPKHARLRYQWLKIDDLEEKVKTIQVIIKSVYRGKKYDDTAISDIILLKYLPDDFKMPRAR